MKFIENGKEKFLFLYQNEYTTLTKYQRTGLSALLDAIENDDNVSDVRHVAYMLATVKHECADTYHPIAEYGKGKGLKYGSPDPVTGLVYYGRGFVQLTWAGNYKTMGKILGVDLYNNPELAMQPDIAYQIMSYGMRHGTFTGASLKQKINDTKCDYINARRIINGTDKAELIACHAERFEKLLVECVSTTIG